MRLASVAFTASIAAWALAVSLAACGPTYEGQGTLKGVRLIGVQKDKPYAAPGETVKLSMLLHDGAPKKRKVSVKWFGGCDNPPGDSYPGCFFGTEPDAGAGPGLPGLRLIGEGLEVEYTVPGSILNRPPPPKGVIPYGLSFVFFTACTGSLRPAPGERVPIQCVDDSGARIDADGFVAGYSQIFAYEALRNENPRIDGFALQDENFSPGEGSPVECIGQDCVELAKREFGIPAENPGIGGAADGGAVDGGAADGGAPVEPPCDPAKERWCVPTCAEENIDDCPEHKIQVSMRESENDDIDETNTSGTLGEQMWVNYYIDRGKVKSDVKILRDATEGWQGDHSDTMFFAPKDPGPFHIWAAAHDNRGGVQWIRLRLYAR
jgi:hypothetical protein